MLTDFEETTRHAPEHLGGFLGDHYTAEELDALIALAVQTPDIEASRSLFESKWWDYRYVHPGYCFFLYAAEYTRAYERWRSLFGVNIHVAGRSCGHPIFRPEKTGKGAVTAVVGEELTKQALRTAFWRGMCFADAHGVPYDRWIELAFQTAFEEQWGRIPLPTSLYSDRISQKILARWEDERKTILHLPKDPLFLEANYQGHRWQDDHQEWLIRLIAARPLPHVPLAQFAFREGRLNEERCVERLGYDVVHRAKLLL